MGLSMIRVGLFINMLRDSYRHFIGRMERYATLAATILHLARYHIEPLS